MNLWTLPTEEAARDAALEAHEVNYAQTLAELRQAMRDAVDGGYSATVVITRKADRGEALPASDGG